jgi:glutamate-ammonia-ligase adenylyltransferase
MIDDLIDSLVLNRPSPTASIRQELAELCRGAEDLGPILRGFRNKEWLRIGTRDILGREPIRRLTRELSDVADAVVCEAAAALWKRQRQQVGVPMRGDGKPARWAIVALGKLGGREILYHSDLDLVFIHETDGVVAHTHPAISNARFFANLAQQVVRELAGGDDGQPLYQVDTRLRPHGSSGELSIALDGFCEYMRSTARPWERLALGRARVVYSTSGFGPIVAQRIQELLRLPIDAEELRRGVCHVRRLKNDAHGTADFKGGQGGMADIEFLAQYLQLRHADALTRRSANTWEALGLLRRSRCIDAAEHRALSAAYNDYRMLESRLRLIHNRHEMRAPADAATNGADAAATRLQTRLARHSHRVSDIFQRRVGSAEQLQEGAT